MVQVLSYFLLYVESLSSGSGERQFLWVRHNTTATIIIAESLLSEVKFLLIDTSRLKFVTLTRYLEKYLPMLASLQTMHKFLSEHPLCK
jgi:hypothetical protein